MNAWEGFEEVVAVADAGSFVGAARRLSVSTSHVSRAIARLEDRLGFSLFYRTTRKVSLTDSGRGFADQCRRLIQERDELLWFAAGDGEPQGELRLTCSTTLGERFIAPIVGQFADKYSQLSVAMDLTNRVVDIVGEGFDIGIRTGDVADLRLVGRKIASRKLETVATPAYLEARGAPRSVDELRIHDCLVGTATTWHFVEKGTPRVFVPKGRWRCNSGEAVVSACLASRGICQLPAYYLKDALANGTLIPVLAECSSEPEPIWLVYPQRRHLLPKVSMLASVLELEVQCALDRS